MAFTSYISAHTNYLFNGHFVKELQSLRTDKDQHYTLNYLVSNDYLSPIETIATEGFARDISLAIPNKFLFS